MRTIRPRHDEDGYSVTTDDGTVDCDAVVVSVPHAEAASVLPIGTIPFQDRLEDLGSSAVVDVHLVYDRPVTEWELMAGHRSPVQWVFDRSRAAGLPPDPGGRQYLAVSRPRTISSGSDQRIWLPRSARSWPGSSPELARRGWSTRS